MGLGSIEYGLVADAIWAVVEGGGGGESGRESLAFDEVVYFCKRASSAGKEIEVRFNMTVCVGLCG